MSPSGPVRANLGNLDRIPQGEGRAFQILGVTIAVFRCRDGSVFATQAQCPHKGGPLADGLVGQRTLVCPLHACGFDIVSGKPAGHGFGTLNTYSVIVDADQQIIVSLD